MHWDPTPPVVVGTASRWVACRNWGWAGCMAQGWAADSCRRAVEATALLGTPGISTAYRQLSHNRQEATQPCWAELPVRAIRPWGRSLGGRRRIDGLPGVACDRGASMLIRPPRLRWGCCRDPTRANR